MTTVERGNTIQFTTTVKDPDDTLTDLTGIVANMWIGTTKQGADISPTPTGTGTYKYNYSVPADAGIGEWVALFYGTSGSLNVRGAHEFQVTDQRLD